MKATRSSNKRKHQSSSDPVTGIVTRSKSEIFLHRNRSGRARFSRNTRPNDNSNLQQTDWRKLRKSPRLSNEEALDDDIARISIKDLRTRRVFSPPSVSTNGCSEDSKLQTSGTEGIEKFDSESPYNAQIENFGEPQFGENFGKADYITEEQRSNEDGEVSCGVDGSVENCVQTTPPDTDIFCKSEVEQNGGNPIGCGLQSRDHTKLDKSYNPSYRSRMGGLIPCSRLKLFKTPNSFSYRRLLPFLMDIAKDNSSSFEIFPRPKLQCYVEGRPLPSRSQDSSIEGNKDPSSDSPQIAKSSETDSTSTSLNVEVSCVESTEQLISESCMRHPPKLHLVSPIHDLTAMIPSDSSQVQQVASENCRRLKPAGDAIGSITGADPVTKSLFFSPISPEFLSVEEGASDSPSPLSIEVEEHCISPLSNVNTDAKSLDSISLHQDSTQLEVSASSERPVPVVGLAKGILKRNPRGCRGLCTCLNCASFRLHAERAFEFSQNQMQDAEEVAEELMKELSCLRDILEKSSGGSSGSNDHEAVQASQVEGACLKASKAEEWARWRLGQMNYDLSIHCRMICLQRPRVRFANNVEEKVIPKI